MPPGLNLVRTLRGHTQAVRRMAWSPTGDLLATPSGDKSVRVWNVRDGTSTVLTGHDDTVYTVAWSPKGDELLSGSADDSVIRWDLATHQGAVIRIGSWVNVAIWHPVHGPLVGTDDGRLIRVRGIDVETLRLDTGGGSITALAFNDEASQLLMGSGSGFVHAVPFRHPNDLSTRFGFRTHHSFVMSLAWVPRLALLISASLDKTIGVWAWHVEPSRVRLLQTLEGHLEPISSVSVAHDSFLAASKGADGVRFWDMEGGVELLFLEESSSKRNSPGIAFNPTAPLLATLDDEDRSVRIWEYDAEQLLRARRSVAVAARVEVTAKVVLLGDSGVGKTGLGWRLTHGQFKEHASTHGQQFWLLENLLQRETDGAWCNVVLWDLAGQPDYRLIHALFIHDADLALVVFDPTNREDPFRGAEYWVNALTRRTRACPFILVAARLDRGDATLPSDAMHRRARQLGAAGGYLGTSALKGLGIDDLVQRIREQIPWRDLPATTTSSSLDDIKRKVLRARENSKQVVLMPLTEIVTSDAGEEATVAIEHLAKQGYARVLRRSGGEPLVLLAPELLNNLAASIILEARRNPEGLGAIDEERLVGAMYNLAEIKDLARTEQTALLDAAATLFIEHNICFRATVGTRTLLVFPELISQRVPSDEDQGFSDDVSYLVSGAVGNLYASLVVLLGYTNTFTRAHHWRNQARYEVGVQQICGFRVAEEREGELTFVLYYSASATDSTRQLFRGLFETFLFQRPVHVRRVPPLTCPGCQYRQERSEVLRRLREGRQRIFCSDCGAPLELPAMTTEPTRDDAVRSTVKRERASAADRTQFEACLVQIKRLRHEKAEGPAPSCFLSYAWGDPASEQWVTTLAHDLRNAGVDVLFDKWHNVVGTSITRFVERIHDAHYVIAVGSPSYKAKYDAVVGNPVVEAEIRLINTRARKKALTETIIPVLYAGDSRAAFPPMLEDHVYLDFRDAKTYFAGLLDIILKVHGLPFSDPAIISVRESIQETSARSGPQA